MNFYLWRSLKQLLMLKFKLIGIYQLITGIFGSIMVLFNVPYLFKNSDLFPSFMIALTLFAGTAIAGYFLLMNHAKAVGYSILSQAFQSVAIVYGGTQYLFSCAAFLAVTYNVHGFQIKSQLSPLAYQIDSVLTTAEVDVKLFLVPLVFIILLSWKRK